MRTRAARREQQHDISGSQATFGLARGVITREVRARFFWPATSLLAVFAYFYSLGGLYIPHIGDEAPYIEIVRLTAESGKWLPLTTAPELENTKPPLLFWLGVVATDWGRVWSLFRLRLAIVLVTIVTAGVVFWLARRLSGDTEVAYISALKFARGGTGALDPRCLLSRRLQLSESKAGELPDTYSSCPRGSAWVKVGLDGDHVVSTFRRSRDCPFAHVRRLHAQRVA